MAERHERCRFYPRCLIHLGEKRPLRFSEANRAEMREMYTTGGMNLSEIAAVFSTRHGVVAPIVQTWKES